MNLLARSASKETRTELSFKAFLGSSFIPLFYDIFISGTQSQGYWGGALVPPPPPHFSRGKMFLFNKYKAHAVSQVPVILQLIREISHWECCKCHVRACRFQNFLGEDSPRPPPPPKKLASPARVFKRSPQLKLRSAVPANDSLWVFPTKSKSWRSPSLWLLKLAISGTPAALTIFVEKPTMKGKRATKHDVRRYT